MDNIMTKQECLDTLNKLKSQLKEHLNTEIEISDIEMFEDVCWSANIEVTRGKVRWAERLDEDITKLPIGKEHTFIIKGRCSRDNENIPENKYHILIIN